MESEKPSEPDSTTLEKDVRQEFRKDEDVLCLNNNDGCFYLGTIVQVDTIYKKCLIEFLDNTRTWSSFKDLKSFAPQESDICYICKESQSKNDNKIIVCKCGRACHQHCHEPVIGSNSIAGWRCRICKPAKRKEEKVAKRVSSNKLVTQDRFPTSESQLPFNIAGATVDERRTDVLDALTTCEKRYKSDREIKKKKKFWRTKFKENASKSLPLSLPAAGPIDDNVVDVYCKKYLKTTEDESKPLQNGYINSSQVGSRKVVSVKSEQKIVPPLVINVPKPYSTSMTYTVSDKEVTTKLNGNLTTDSKVISSTEYHGRGLVKRSTPFPPQDQANNLDTRFRSHAVRKARRLLNKHMKRKKKTVETSVLASTASSDSSCEKSEKVSQDKYSYSRDESITSRKYRMDLRKKANPPEVRKRPQRNLLEARLNSTESKLYNPFVSVDSSDIRRRSVTQDNKKKSLPTDNTAKSKTLKGKANANEKGKSNKTKFVQKSIYESFNFKFDDKLKLELVPVAVRLKGKENEHREEKVTIKSDEGGKSLSCTENSDKAERLHGESDVGVDTTDDETSSRGTLEPFIPTPKDFEGRNNPFRSVTDLLNTAAGVPPPSNPPAAPITLPLPLKTVIPHIDPPRLTKRQLSEKDIIIDRNGQVKRRRRHRKNTNGLIQTTIPHGTASKSAQIVPARNKKPWAVSSDKQTLQPLANNCMVNPLSTRHLRNRESSKSNEKQAATAKPASVKCSPSKETTTVNEDLESSVKYFFGTASRIANGEKYEIKARRITFDGRLQCIIDWKGYPT